MPYNKYGEQVRILWLLKSQLERLFQTLYNLRNDPFEIDNLLDTKNPKQMHLDEVKKIKKWAKNQLKCWNTNASGGVSN